MLAKRSQNYPAFLLTLSQFLDSSSSGIHVKAKEWVSCVENLVYFQRVVVPKGSVLPGRKRIGKLGFFSLRFVLSQIV